MKRHALLFVSLLLLLPALLTACSTETALHFHNDTECGAATITLTNVKTGNIHEYTVEQGKDLKIEVDEMVEYHYEVVYPRSSSGMQCDTKNVSTMLEEGKIVNIHLTSVLDETLINATATAEAATSGD